MKDEMDNIEEFDAKETARNYRRMASAFYRVSLFLVYIIFWLIHLE